MAVHGFWAAQVAIGLLLLKEPRQAAFDVLSVGPVLGVRVIGAQETEQCKSGGGDVGIEFGQPAALTAAVIEVLGGPATIGSLMCCKPLEGQRHSALGGFAAAHLLDDLHALGFR